MLNINLQNSYAFFDGEIDKKAAKEIDMLMSYELIGHNFMNINNSWDGRIRLLKGNKFPIGLVDSATDILEKHNIEYKINDLRPTFKYGPPVPSAASSPFKARDYQVEAVNACIRSGSGIARMCTGSGKTFVIASLVAHYNVPSIIYVISVDLLYQMVDTLKKAFNIDAGIIGDGKCDIKKINIMTIWSAGAAFNKKLDSSYAENAKLGGKEPSDKSQQIQDLVKGAKLFILDECQYAGSDTFQFINNISMSARHRFLFSGTPWREAGDDILLEAVAGKKVIDISASKLIKEGHLVKPKILFKDVPPMKGVGRNYHEVYSNYISKNVIRNTMAVNAGVNFFKKGHSVLFLVKKIEHGNIIADMLKAKNVNFVYLDGSKSSSVRTKAIEKARTGEVKVIIASSIFDQGVDIPNLDVLIHLGGGKSTGRMLQRIGRVIRGSEGKDKAFVLDFIDNAKYLKEHSAIRYDISKSESEFMVIKQS